MSQTTNPNTDRNSVQTTERVPMVFRIVRTPRVLWNEEIVPLMLKFGVDPTKIPDADFNVYKWMIIEKFVKEANTTFFLKLLATCLERAGIEINLVADIPVATLTTAEDEDAYNNSIEIIKSMMRFRNRNPEYRQKQSEIMAKYPANLTQIKDVAK